MHSKRIQHITYNSTRFLRNKMIRKCAQGNVLLSFFAVKLMFSLGQHLDIVKSQFKIYLAQSEKI